MPKCTSHYCYCIENYDFCHSCEAALCDIISEACVISLQSVPDRSLSPVPIQRTYQVKSTQQKFSKGTTKMLFFDVVKIYSVPSVAVIGLRN